MKRALCRANSWPNAEKNCWRKRARTLTPSSLSTMKRWNCCIRCTPNGKTPRNCGTPSAESNRCTSSCDPLHGSSCRWTACSKCCTAHSKRRSLNTTRKGSEKRCTACTRRALIKMDAAFQCSPKPRLCGWTAKLASAVGLQPTWNPDWTTDSSPKWFVSLMRKPTCT